MKELDIEAFINSRREEFDDERPSLKVWANIERGIDRDAKKMATRRLIWRSIAASFLLLIGIGMGLKLYPRLQEQQALQAINDATDLDEMEIFFAQEIDARLVALRSVGLDQESEQSLADTNREIQKLKLDLIYAPKSSREEIMQAIIATYETKIYILETILERVSPTNGTKNESTIL